MKQTIKYLEAVKQDVIKLKEHYIQVAKQLKDASEQIAKIEALEIVIKNIDLKIEFIKL